MTCHIQEYEYEELFRKDPLEGLNGYKFGYGFLPPRSSRGEWTNMDVKTLKRELFIQTGFTLVGSVGGWFGLMIGFSFNGLADGIIDLCHQVWVKFRSKR